VSITMTIEIPALDRLCGWLESRDKAGLVAAIEEEIVAKLKEAAEGGVPRPVFKEVPPAEDHPWKDEAKERPTTAEAGRQEKTTSPAPDGAPSPKGEGSGKPVTLDAVQRAAAQMRDDGKLKAVTDMFPEFGIKKLSDLKGDALQAFAERLRAMGAKI